MDTNDNMEYLDDSSTLPELSFDDLLDPSPIKKNTKLSFDDDALELDNERKNHTDDTLNTPGPKKPPTIQKNIAATSNRIESGSKILTPVRTQAVKLGISSSTLNNAVKNNGGTTPAPVLLNSKNVLPKTATQITNDSTIKLTQKVVGGSSSNLSLSGKTAVRTSNGQIIYIQKSAATANIKTAGTGNNSKPVTIQVLRTPDGSYVPIKTTTTGTNGKNTTLTLSPTSLAGKKIISSAGGQVIIKGTLKSTDSTATASTAKTTTTNAITGVKTMVQPMTSSSAGTGQLNEPNRTNKPIVVHGTSGKQIIVSNPNIVKLSPKPQNITTTAGGCSANTSTTTTPGQIHAIQIPGKIGVQYVRVLPNTKITTKSSSVTSTVSAPVTATKTLSVPSQPGKMFNSLPQKFTVVQKGGTTKLVLTQKKEMNSGNNAEISPMTTKVQKTIVTVPTIKSLNEDNNKNPQTNQQQQSLIKPTTQSSFFNSSNNSSGSSTNNQTLVRKHKISEINSEIQRITTTADYAGAPEIKKPTPNNRVVVVSSSSQPKVLNNSIQQPGRVTSSISIPARNPNTGNSSRPNTGGGSVVQVTQVTQNGNKLYTVLKPPALDQKPNSKLYSVLKTNNQTTTTSTSTTVTATATSSAKPGISKPLINKQQLLQQQQKLLQLKQQTVPAQNTKSLNTSTYLLPIKIKEEPTDPSPTTALANHDETTGAAQLNLPSLIVGEEEADNMDPMVGGVRRKHCNCSKSQCLKLYCDCFANGEFCQDCTCKDCFNNLENEDERQRAIKTCLERNPNAFKPKITSSRDQADMRLHNKGCNCKRSGCLKNYCECYEAKIPCSSNCKCVGCRNVEDRPDLDMDPIDPKIMATIAMGGTADNVSLKRTYDKSQRDFSGSLASGVVVKTEKLTKEPIKSFNSYDTMTGTISPALERQQCNFITQEVIDATIQCMITQADECEKNNLPVYQTEKMIMEELGRCLVEIIDFSIRNTDNSYSQD